MGISAIKSHARGKKHADKMMMRNPSSTLYFVKSTDKETNTTSTGNGSTTSTVNIATAAGNKSQTLLPSVVANASATEAEIIWTIRTILLHNSNRSCDGLSKLFQ